MKVIVGLLIVIGAMLEETEGINCYKSEGKALGKSVNCSDNGACLTFLYKNIGKVSRECSDDVARGCDGCVPINTKEELEKWLRCIVFGPGRTATQYNTEDLLAKFRGTFGNGRQSGGTQVCTCYTDLCNNHTIGDDDGKDEPNKGSTANTQVVFGILVAASLNAGLGSL